MTRDECKDLLVEKIGVLGGVRSDELVAWSYLYTVPGFSEVFHPDMLKHLLAERRIVGLEYKTPTQETSFMFLLPVDTKIKAYNTKVE